MRIASGTIAFLALTVGALLLLVAVDSFDDVMNSGRRPPKTSYLRSDSSRKLYNYSTNNNDNQNYNGYNGAYGGSYGGNYGGGDYGGDDGGNNNGGNYGGNYGGNDDGNNGGNDDANNGGNYGGNYGGNNNDDVNNNGNNGDDNYGGDYGNNGDDQNYYNYAMDNYGNDDASYYNSNQNYQADGSSYNGRDQEWGGQSVQTYDDDEEPEVTEEVYTEEDRWEILGKFGSLSGAETLAVAGLAVTVSLTLLCCFLLFNGFNLIDVIQLYCCCGLFSHKDQGSEVLEDGFVKLGDY